MIDIDQIKLIDLIPGSIKNDKQIIAAAEALDNELKRVNEYIDRLSLMATIDEQPEEVVDFLAWERHVDYYESDMSLDIKKNVVKSSKQVHRTKGTPSAVKKLIAAVFGDAALEEWFQYGGNPYRFKVITSGIISDEKTFNSFFKALNVAKNTRSHLDKIIINRGKSNRLYFGQAVASFTNCTLHPKVVRNSRGNLYVGQILYQTKTLTIGGA